MKITVTQKGDFSKTKRFLNNITSKRYLKSLEKYGQMGVDALTAATPKQTGLTAHSWTYRIIDDGKSVSIEWLNQNIQNGVPIAIILQYGHGTRNGGYVRGRDYINPALQPVFNSIAEQAWGEVTKA